MAILNEEFELYQDKPLEVELEFPRYDDSGNFELISLICYSFKTHFNAVLRNPFFEERIFRWFKKGVEELEYLNELKPYIAIYKSAEKRKKKTENKNLGKND